MSKPTANIKFHFLTPGTLPHRRKLKAFILDIFKTQKMSLNELSIIFCSDDYLLTLNQKFLKHDYYTDILSFSLSLPGNPLTAEIYISLDRVKENAHSLNYSYPEELHRVIFHGILHFCGFKDKRPSDIKLMRAMEDKSLKAYFKKLND